MMNLKDETLDTLIKGVDQNKLIAALNRTLGREKLLANFSKEEILSAVGNEEILRQMLANLGTDQLHKMIDQISRNKPESN